MTPKSENLAPANSTISREIDALLGTYINFLTASIESKHTKSINKLSIDAQICKMAAIFDPSNPASPLSYNASQTALMLLDFQGLTIERCGPTGALAMNKAEVMRDWALSSGVMVVHSVVDVHGEPPKTCKGAERIAKMLAEVANDKAAAEEPTQIAFSQSDQEYIVLKHPGFVSALKSHGAMELLREHDIRSLIICGLSTSGAVLRTTMPATDEGFVVSVIQDACGDPVAGLHDILMEKVLPSRAHVATAEHFIAEWRKPIDG